MMTNEYIVVGLDVGTSKICAAVGERAKSGEVNIIGIGECESRGLRKGEIVDRVQAEACIREAVAHAEESSGVEIRNVTLAITGGHVRSFNNRGVVPVTSEHHEITDGDVEAVLRNARAINISVQNDIMNTLRQHFHVDGQDGVLNPVGMTGAKLEVNLHVIHGVRTRIQNTIRCVNAIGLGVDDVVFSGLASALGVLTHHDREIGSVVIDCGGGTTEYVAYVGDSVEHSGILAVGGDHFSNDVATGLGIPMSLAERLKLQQGSAALDAVRKKQVVPILNEESFVGRREIPRHTLCQILRLRAEETLSLIKQEIQRRCPLEYFGAGVILCGGSAQLEGIEPLAYSVFGLPARVGRVCEIAGLADDLQKPQYATTVGLVKFGLDHQIPTRLGVAPLLALTNRLTSFFVRARNLF